MCLVSTAHILQMTTTHDRGRGLLQDGLDRRIRQLLRHAASNTSNDHESRPLGLGRIVINRGEDTGSDAQDGEAGDDERDLRPLALYLTRAHQAKKKKKKEKRKQIVEEDGDSHNNPTSRPRLRSRRGLISGV